jgi:FKBP-type peptidyl-prolyl cis-trans isomerase FkpA
MKPVYYLFIVFISAGLIASCGNLNYNKTKSGLLYKIIPGDGKDSLLRNGEIAKFNLLSKLNDSVVRNTFGRLPFYAKVQEFSQPPYNLLEILPMMRKGDSAITVQLADTMFKLNQQDQMPPNAKKGDRLVVSIRILDVFPSDSLAMKDYTIEQEKDKPLQLKEQQEQMAKMKKTMEEQQAKEYEELEKSGEAAKQRKVVEDYLAAKHISAQKTGKGTYVFIETQGNGPKADSGKYVTVKYTGRRLENDSVFQSSIYPLQLGVGAVIPGWDEGLQLFNEGGKGTIYIPGYRAYGNNPRPGSPFKPGDALIFDVEILKVSDKPNE